MTKKDILELQTVCAAYSMAYSLNELLDEIYSDLPEMIECYNLRNYLKDFLNDLNHYRCEKEDLLLSACDDSAD